MPVQLRCDCGKLLRARDELVGKRVKCPGCGAALLVKAAPRPDPPDGEGIQEAPPHRLSPGPAAGPQRPRGRAPEDESQGQPAYPERPRPPRAQGDFFLWVVVSGIALAVVGAVVLLVVLAGGEPPTGRGGPGPVGGGAGRPPPQDPRAGLDEGFIRTWLLLAPIPLRQNQSGTDALGEEQLPGEAALRPRPGETVRVGGRELTWTAYHARDYFFDFNDFLGARTEDSVGYAACYVHAPTELRGVQLRTSSDDQSRVYLNGREVIRQDQARALMKDQDVAEVDLHRGVNVLVFKVVNEKLDWSGCARFTDRGGNAIQGLRVTTTPE